MPETVHEEMLRRAAQLLDGADLTPDVVGWLNDYRIWVAEPAHNRRFEYVWLPEPDPRWVLLSEPTELYRCRGQRDCISAPVVKLDRSRASGQPRWWYYCEPHAFGRRINGGVLEHRALVPKGTFL
jgi:hypothetical protein